MIRIRNAEGRDESELARIFYEVRRQHFHWVDSDTIKPGDFVEQTEGEDVYVAECGDELAGFISVWAPESFIHHLYIKSGFQRRRIGEALIEHAKSLHPLPFRLKCSESNDAALAFYRRNGWTEAGRGVSKDGPYLLMELNE